MASISKGTERSERELDLIDASTRELFLAIVHQLRILTLHFEELSGEEFTLDDLNQTEN